MSEKIGVVLDQDELILQKGRDFKWALESVDENNDPIDYPAGDLYFELQTGGAHNGTQHVEMLYATGGDFKFGLGNNWSVPIEYDTLTVRPHLDQDSVKGYLEDIVGIGDGNVLVSPAVLTPVWQLSISLTPAHNEVQRIKLNNAGGGGQYKLGSGQNLTSLINYADTDLQIAGKIAAMASVGANNVKVTKNSNTDYQVEFIGSLAKTNVPKLQAYAYGFGWGLNNGIFSSISVSTVSDGLAQITETLIEVLSDSINDVYNSFENLYGVRLDFNVLNPTQAVITATSIKTYTELKSKVFSANVTGDMIKNAVGNVAELGPILDVVGVKFYWNRSYDIEFTGALANLPMPQLKVDTTGLTSTVQTPEVNVTVTKPGKAFATIWPFNIIGHRATIKIESEEVDKIANRVVWYLAFKPAGEAKGGDPVGMGRVRVQK